MLQWSNYGGGKEIGVQVIQFPSYTSKEEIALESFESNSNRQIDETAFQDLSFLTRARNSKEAEAKAISPLHRSLIKAGVRVCSAHGSICGFRH